MIIITIARLQVSIFDEWPFKFTEWLFFDKNRGVR